MESAAVLVVGMAELDGIVTREHKIEIVELFISEFRVTRTVAAEMYASSSHMLKDIVNIVDEVKNILTPTRTQYENRHVDSLMMMLSRVSHSEGEPTKIQLDFLNAVENELGKAYEQPQKW